ncbi:Regulator_of chromosome condensation 1/beta-lactamase-inhibitor protein II [Hexamita inflata]|uniref:Regulator of chromosome condensation 1/beta-lactamase-inhibitor protein II n=2 Tax=Hexamita inflata TaxID=28002 RepID=A0AA86UK85_9EUKA|nr:Regulator of chromosome condensation 1/beta-lactamase-inhibitor protein II [Hexamita inflata]
MIIIISLQNVIYPKLQQRVGLTVGELSQDSNILDIISCDSVIYQIAQNRSLMAKGQKQSLFHKETQLEFVYFGFDGALQLFCTHDSKLLVITKDGFVYTEKLDSRGWISFIKSDDPLLVDVLQITGGWGVQVVLTKSKLLVSGICSSDSKVCDKTAPGFYQTFTELQTDISASNIKRIEWDKSSGRFVYVYLYNGDVYALGANEDGALPSQNNPDTASSRLIGTGITKVAIGKNVTQNVTSTYFIKNNTLYNFYQTKENQLLDNVLDFQISDINASHQSIICLRNESVISIFGLKSQTQNGTDIYCTQNAGNEQCKTQNQGLQVVCTDLNGIQISNDYCNIADCYKRMYGDNQCAEPSCTLDQASNQTCWAVACMYPSQRNNPQCFFNFTTTMYAYNLSNAQEYVFTNAYLRQYKQSQPTPTPNTPTMRAGNAVGIAVAVCTAIFVTIILVLWLTHKYQLRKLKKQEEQSQDQTSIMAVIIQKQQAVE